MHRNISETGVVYPGALYTLEALKQNLGVRAATLRAARRAGLRVYYKHGRGFVHGRDWIAYICSPDQPQRHGLGDQHTNERSAFQINPRGEVR